MYSVILCQLILEWCDCTCLPYFDATSMMDVFWSICCALFPDGRPWCNGKLLHRDLSVMHSKHTSHLPALRVRVHISHPPHTLQWLEPCWNAICAVCYSSVLLAGFIYCRKTTLSAEHINYAFCVSLIWSNFSLLYPVRSCRYLCNRFLGSSNVILKNLSVLPVCREGFCS